MRRLGIVIACATGCAGAPGASAPQAASKVTAAVAPVAPAPVACADVVTLVEHGVERGPICATDAAARGLTLLELADTWTPTLFALDAAGNAPSYRATYLKLAGAHTDAEEALGELYGIVPSFAIVRERLADDARHACHANIASAPIGLLARSISQDDRDAVRGAEQRRAGFAAQLERERVKRDLPDLAALAGVKELAARYARWKTVDDQHAALVAAEQHLACDGYLPAKDADGSFTWKTGNAVELFQRRNFLMPNERLDPETREALLLDSHERDFRLALRILREHVVDASGLVEDGTAGAGPQPVLGRLLDPEAMRVARGGAPLPDAAPDLVSQATEAAATELGWTDATATRAFLERHAAGVRVAIKLPPAPAYHAAHMALSAEIDRGDVYYDEQPIARRVAHRPTLVLYVDDGGTRRPLLRWPTTIGGWADQRTAEGEVLQRWKESDVGPRVWRELYAAPTWLAPKTTPDRDLVKNLYNGHWGLKSEVFGPGPHAAYGMMLLVHEQVVKQKDGPDRYDDNGIGTHGSASVTSIVNGTSHGCHRLYNQLAVRLADFLLHHRDHVAKGEQPESYRRVIEYQGTFVETIKTRGYLYEMTPPVPVMVTKGRILSERKSPPVATAAARP